MDELLSEKEQIEKLRAWWSENGLYVIGGLVIGAGILFGINYQQSSVLNERQEASALYDRLAEHADAGELDEAVAIAEELGTGYGDTSYAAQSKLAMARLYMDRSRDQDAADALRELLAGGGSDELKMVGRLRLAKVLLYQEKAQEVIELLEDQGNVAFAAQYAEVLGDAYLAEGRIEDARVAYQNALNESMNSGNPDQQLVQLKLLDLPPESTSPESPLNDEPAPDEIVDDMVDNAADATAGEAAVESSGEIANGEVADQGVADQAEASDEVAQ